MIRGRRGASLAVRRQDGSIGLRDIPLVTWANGPARRVPLARGILVLVETLVVGMRSLAISANEAAAEEPADRGAGAPAEPPISSIGMSGMFAAALIFGVGLFFVLPLLVSRAVESSGSLVANLTEGGLRLALFLGYIWAIGQMKDIKRVFGYHGAEHMAVSAHEHGDPLTSEALRRYPTAHPRCGTSFLLTVVLVSIIVFIFVPREPFWFVLMSRIVLIPVIAALSYELIRFAGFHQSHPLVRAAMSPNLLLQRMTTRKPDEGMMEVAIAAMNHAIAKDEAQPEKA